MTAVVIAQGDDWEGLYIGGSLAVEGHSLDMVKTFKLILRTMPTIIAEDISTREVNLDWIEDQGRLPFSIDEVKWADEVYPIERKDRPSNR